MTKLTVDKNGPPVGALLTAKAAVGLKIPVSWGTDTSYTLEDGAIGATTSVGIARCIARQTESSGLYGIGILQKTEVDHWLTFCLGPLSCSAELANALQYLDQVLKPTTFLVGQAVTISDYCVFGALHQNPHWLWFLEKGQVSSNLLRWYKMMLSRPECIDVLKGLPESAKVKASPIQDVAKEKKEESAGGKFIDLPGAEMGKVVVRFPPEASGFLHVGHAKAALLNYHYRDTFQGKLIMRFDDTNPAKEKEEYEDVILEDLKLLQIKYDHFSRTSDHFETILGYCEKLLKEGKAYVDDTDAETMKAERDAKVESRNRSNSAEKNLKMWEEMKKASDVGVKCAVRAKIDMQSLNGCLRDPTIYRCKPEPHPATGTKYKVYPTYDFACPIVDSVEGVTHALRTTEYMDRDDQFFWFIEALGLRKPHIWAYARLNLTNTVMSKRKLTWLVDEGIVEGWNDPRLPTVRGVLRRGLTVEALKQFIIAQGSSRSVVFMEWDKIWAFNKKVIDPIVPRHTTVDKSYRVPVHITNAKPLSHKAARHPKNPDVGEKTVWTGPELTIDGVDAELLKEGENATFINWGNLAIKKVNKANGKVVSVDAEDNTDNKDFKKTMKLTWLCSDPVNSPLTPAVLIYYDHIIKKAILDKEDDFKSFVENDSKHEVEMVGDPELRNLKKGDVVQIQRRGYFICDLEYQPFNPCVGRARPVVLIAIPDGTAGSYGPPGKAAVQAPASSKGKDKVGAKPASKKAAPKPVAVSPPVSSSSNADEISSQIQVQGEKVRTLKEKKADKATIGDAVKVLLELKAGYKAATGKDWKPENAGAGNASIKTTTSPPAAGSAAEISAKIIAQGDLVRKLKGDKAPKTDIDAAVKSLLSLKADFKASCGKDWKPGMEVPASSPAPAPAAGGAAEINANIIAQGDLVRKLKGDKAPKTDIDAAVKSLLSLKADFKASCGKDWKPGMEVPASSPVPAPAAGGNLEALNQKITAQGDLVRKLKAEKADKSAVQEAVNTLLALKAEYKKDSGKDWKPEDTKKLPAKEPAAPKLEGGSGDLDARITAQGEQVRTLKTSKADKASIDAAVKTLLELKAEFKSVNGKDWQPAGGPAKPRSKPDKSKQKEKPAAVLPVAGVTRLGVEAKKEDNLPDWYSQVLTKAEMMEYYDVSGCYILRPWSFAIWESIKEFIDREIKKLDVENCYFPCFVSHAALEREKTHISDFAPEVAWVTRSGNSEMAEPIAIRPTSETVMYPAYAKWIQSYRDLPLKLNQWNNVVRWEFKHPQPFLRTREFLWQEGHTAFANLAEAKEEVMTILDLYRRVYEELLAIPVVRGRKTEKEKFAGGDYTTTVEAFISAAGRAIQGATSHHLGQNFSKMFDITYENPETGEKEYVYQNSWGMTTRTIGVLVMVHGDNSGLVLPPRVACLQVVIVPCGVTASLKAADRETLYKACDEYKARLVKAGVRVKADMRENYSPGWKFNHWEQKGVPIRLEVGPRDIKESQYVVVRRDTGEKIVMRQCGLEDDVPALLETIQSSMFARAREELANHLKIVDNFPDFLKGLDEKCLLQAPFCGEEPCEDEIKEMSKKDADLEPGAPSMGAKSLCIPFTQPAQIKGDTKCVRTGCTNKPQFYTLFGRSY